MDNPNSADYEKRLSKLEENVRQAKANDDEIFKIQGESLKKLNTIHDLLAGNAYERERGDGHGGGLVRRVERLETCNDDTTKFKEQTRTRNRIIWTAIAAFGLYIINGITDIWDKIFK